MHYRSMWYKSILQVMSSLRESCSARSNDDSGSEAAGDASPVPAGARASEGTASAEPDAMDAEVTFLQGLLMLCASILSHYREPLLC